jgi:hypothetical protein
MPDLMGEVTVSLMQPDSQLETKHYLELFSKNLKFCLHLSTIHLVRNKTKKLA